VRLVGGKGRPLVDKVGGVVCVKPVSFKPVALVCVG
jgi:hypothetical protein